MKEERQKKIRETDHQVQVFTARLAEAQRLGNMENEETGTNAYVRNAKAEANKAQSLLRDLSAKLARLETERDAKRLALSNLSAQSERLDVDIEQEQRTYAEYVPQAEAAKEQERLRLGRLESDKSQLQQQISSVKMVCRQLEGSIREKQQSAEQLKNSTLDSTNKAVQVETFSVETQAKKQAVSLQLSAAKEAERVHRVGYEKYMSEAADMRRKLKLCRDELDVLDEVKVARKKQRDDLHDKREALRRELNAAIEKRKATQKNAQDVRFVLLSPWCAGLADSFMYPCVTRGICVFNGM